MKTLDVPFWKQKKLNEMNRSEWESLCDGCAKCCLNKVEDEDTGEILYTKVACQLLDLVSCRCINYPNRRKYIADCQILNPKKVKSLPWLPQTCAYRLIHEGKDLPSWHHLVSGQIHTVHKARISVRGKAIAERKGIDLRDFVVDWVL